MIGTEGTSPDILGIEMTPSVVRAIRLNRDDRDVVAAAECPVLSVGDSVALDPAAIGPALDEVMYQLGVDDRTDHLAAVSIGPLRAGVGSGPALPAWIEHRARQLGENMVCAGKLGISFCPQRALDTAIMVCEQANITVSRIDFAPVAAARTLDPGTDTITLGSGRGWRARLRDDEILEALESADVSFDDSLQIVSPDGVTVSIDSFHGISLAAEAKSAIEDDVGRYASAVGAAIGVIDGSSSNLLDGDTVRGRQVPAAFTNEIGGVDTGEIAGSRTTVNLSRSEPEARSVIRQVGTVVEPPGEPDPGSLDSDPLNSDPLNPDLLSGLVTDTEPDTESEADLDSGGSDEADIGSGIDLDGSAGLIDSIGSSSAEADADFDVDFDVDRGFDALSEPETGLSSDPAGDSDSASLLGFGFDGDDVSSHEPGLEVHPDDPIRSFSPEPDAEATIDSRGRGRGLALVVAGLILFSLAIAIGIIVTQG